MLMTKVQRDNQIKPKNLKETNQVLEACKKKYQELYLTHETLKKSLPNNKKNYSIIKIILKMEL